MDPCWVLLIAIFRQWRTDLCGSDEELREQALAWIHSPDCLPLCALGGVEPETLRQFADTTQRGVKDLRYQQRRKEKTMAPNDEKSHMIEQMVQANVGAKGEAPKQSSEQNRYPSKKR
jgi:hypothetical protein